MIAYLISRKVFFTNSINYFKCVQTNSLLDPAGNSGGSEENMDFNFLW